LVGMNPETSLQSLLSNNGYPSSLKSDNGKNNKFLAENGITATVMNRSYSHTSFSIELASGDGDSVSLSYEGVEYSESIMQLQAETDPEKIKELATYIKDQFHSIKNELMKKLFGNHESDKNKIEPATSSQLPEYWNAENTSTRIVDFAVSFYGIVSAKGQDYLDQIKAAIEEGFKQAKGFLGELPEETEKLVSNTYDLVMKKLDSWATDN
ncbi:MAG TPA: DUF5610 domain-containing protein, partial [Chitinispirillaceae bacterium]|nr:DUF5610 domain-containing protein [Chitinispirillaceae bacterium]